MLNKIQNGIMLIMGAAAGAVCFRHVHDVTVAYGQPSWVGWVNAVTVELMAVALGLELRRRKRTGEPTRFVGFAMMAFIFVSLAAQVVEAQRSVIGWLAAAIPALGFLTLVKVALSRKAEEKSQPAGEPVTESSTRVVDEPIPARSEPVEPAPQVSRPFVEPTSIEASAPIFDFQIPAVNVNGSNGKA